MFKILDEKCTPTKGSKFSAAIDLYAREDIIILAGETVKVPLGVCIDLEKHFDYMMENVNDNYETPTAQNNFIKRHYLQLEPRSSLRAKGLIAATGIIDLDYEDEIMIILHNPVVVSFPEKLNKYSYVGEPCKINKGDKIAQIMLCEHKSYLFGIDTEDERVGGFGSTGL